MSATHAVALIDISDERQKRENIRTRGYGIPPSGMWIEWNSSDGADCGQGGERRSCLADSDANAFYK